MIEKFERRTFLLIILAILPLTLISVLNPFKTRSPKYVRQFANSKEIALPEKPCGKTTTNTKNLWIASSQGRLHHHISAPESSYQIQPTQFGYSLKETMFSPTILIEDAYTQSDHQRTYRILTAREGEYTLPAQQAICKDVYFSSSQDSKEQKVTGMAKEVVIEFTEISPSFTAKGFRCQKETP